jgi:hypothetical protein
MKGLGLSSYDESCLCVIKKFELEAFEISDTVQGEIYSFFRKSELCAYCIDP